MKVGLIVPGFSAHERDWCIPALLDFVRALARDAEVVVFALRWPERVATYTVAGATVRSLGGRKRLGARAAGLWTDALRAVADEHRRRRFDLLHAVWADEPGWVAAIAARLLGAPLVVSLAGGELVQLHDIAYGLERLRGRRTLVRWTLRRASAVTAGSKFLMDLSRSRLPAGLHARLRLAPLGVDGDRFRPGLRRQTPRPPLLLNVGSLTPVKAQADLIRALRLVTGARLRIAGGGPLRPDLYALATSCGVGDRVELAGEIDHAAMPGVYRAADLVVQASRHEAQGMAILEAAACGIPVAGTPVGVMPEVGVATPIESLAGMLDRLVADPDRRARLGRECRDRVLAEYSLPAAMPRFWCVYDEVTGRPSSPARTPGPSPAPTVPR